MAIRQETNTPAASVHQSVQMRTDDCLVEWLQSFKSVSSRVRHILKTITIRNTTQNSKRICSNPAHNQNWMASLELYIAQ